MKARQGGFTLIELIMVIVILGALAVIALPRYIDLQSQAEVASADGVLGAAQAAAAINFSGNLLGAGGPLITDGATLIAAMSPVPSGWVADGANICRDSNDDGVCGGETYVITVDSAESPTDPAVLIASWQ